MARQIGLKNINVALLTLDNATTTTYEVPQKLERAIKATLKPKATQIKIYSDDSVEEVLNTFDSIDVTIELNQLSLASRALLQGSKVVNGILVESKDDVPPILALGFQSKKTNGKYRYVWLYKGSFGLGDDTYESEADKIKDQTASLTATFYARDSDGLYRLICDEDEVGADPAVISTWFTGVTVAPTASTITTATVIIGKEAIVTGIAGTVITVATGTTADVLKTALQVDGGKGTFKLYTDDTKVTEVTGTTTVTSTMVVETTAQDATTKATYTIVIA